MLMRRGSRITDTHPHGKRGPRSSRWLAELDGGISSRVETLRRVRPRIKVNHESEFRPASWSSPDREIMGATAELWPGTLTPGDFPCAFAGSRPGINSAATP